MAKINSFDSYKLMFTVGIIGPLFLAISRGLPLDCLNYEKAILKENSQSIE